ncbi:hypothetical protein ACFOW1_15215 [Parasediminibacterium paludis]|uniref:Cadherin-like beta sandwich domain-containing protein n=1 Tax=Parasediminibacterium paludis TaxID=908966 RepID=A0ABV8Q149_9BACT
MKKNLIKLMFVMALLAYNNKNYAQTEISGNTYKGKTMLVSNISVYCTYNPTCLNPFQGNNPLTLSGSWNNQAPINWVPTGTQYSLNLEPKSGISFPLKVLVVVTSNMNSDFSNGSGKVLIDGTVAAFNVQAAPNVDVYNSAGNFVSGFMNVSPGNTKYITVISGDGQAKKTYTLHF